MSTSNSRGDIIIYGIIQFGPKSDLVPVQHIKMHSNDAKTWMHIKIKNRHKICNSFFPWCLSCCILNIWQTCTWIACWYNYLACYVYIPYRIPRLKKKIMHRPGIEPGPPAWQASILPLNHRCFENNKFKTFYIIEMFSSDVVSRNVYVHGTWLNFV